jgi:hypothetical protein
MRRTIAVFLNPPAGHRLISELVFGSKLESIQATLPNPRVVVGLDCCTPWNRLPESAE